MGVSDERL
jgi:choline transport protein